MRKLSNIAIEQSIFQKRIICDKESADGMDHFFIYVILGTVFFGSIAALADLDYNNPNHLLLAYAGIPLLILCCAYVLYRKITEKHLFFLKTSYTKKQLLPMLLDFAKEYSMELYPQSDGLLLFNETPDESKPEYKKTSIFIIRDYEIHFAVLKDHYKLNYPVLFEHLLLRRELKKLI
jgi:hypothetical protein